jgi:hypothetical protein
VICDGRGVRFKCAARPFPFGAKASFVDCWLRIEAVPALQLKVDPPIHRRYG